MRFCILFVLAMAISVASFSQKEVFEDSGWSLKERGYVGLGFGGLGIGTNDRFGNYFSIGASLLGGYMITKNLSAGVGFEYQYTSYSQLRLRDHLYGGYPFVRYNIKNFFLQADYNLYSVQTDLQNPSEREIFDRFLIGAGYFSPTRRGAVNFLVSYDFQYTNLSPWASPLNTRFFFTF